MVVMKLRVRGMSCAHCESKAEKAASELVGVRLAKANAAKGLLELAVDDGAPTMELRARLGSRLAKLGYELAPAASAPSRDDLLALGAGVIVAGAFAGLEALGMFSGVPRLGGPLSLGTMFMAGLVTSLHCISMCGGIALSQGLRVAPAAAPTADPAASAPGAAFPAAALRPSILYNLGRITSYTAIGAVAGATGSALRLGLGFQAGIMMAAGLFMLLMGLSLAGLLRLPRLRWKAYAEFRGRVEAAAAKLGPYAVGLANGFMPCGPLQAMQAYALGSGSALAGALGMAAFSAGTAPLLFLFGSGGAFVAPRYRGMAVKAGGVLVLFLGFVTMSRAWALTPRAYAAAPSPTAAAPALAAPARPSSSGVRAELKDGFQEAVVVVGARSYGEVVAKAGLPLRINLRVEPGRLNGCNDAIVIPSLGLRQSLKYGDNWVEFTPAAPGVIPYSCWMGMIHSRIVVEP